VGSRRPPEAEGPARAAGGGNRVRLIAGTHRGRKLAFPDAAGLRPTGDRVRETLFNWLQGVLPGARCLDLFAGSGALGLEAASRGAAEVVLVESAPAVACALRANVATLGFGDRVRVVEADALRWLATARPVGFDVVFLDPPFASGLLGPALDALERGGWLADGVRIYLERSGAGGWPLPEGLTLLRDKRAGQVAYALAGRASG
jgi:16S rRNA (guanine966-N2)-methyltransferase